MTLSVSLKPGGVPVGRRFHYREIIMATNQVNQDVLSSTRFYVANSPLVGAVVAFEHWLLSYWGLVTLQFGLTLALAWWLLCFIWSRRWEHRARVVIKDLDSFEDDLDTIIAEVRALHGAPAAGPPAANPQTGMLRYRQHRAREMTIALADKAYFQFGHRPVTDANKLITRKYMRDLLTGLKDLRTKDANIIIDGALLLSFLPSAVLRRMTEISRTRTYVERAQERPSWCWWWGPFGGPSVGDQ